ncbi:MAG TPA: metal ABC transporter substrate-binding protein [Patescibacteria group bacterium]|nr:metal ABC transporter substrate-binding protein [Patescibacteria group bacterium]
MLAAILVAATLSVAATSTDLRDLVAAVGADRVRVESLTDPRQDPHAREIVPRQVALLKSAALLVRIGLDHEPWLPRAVAAAGITPRDVDVSRAVVVLDSDVPRLSADARPHLHAYGNPHYWLDPENARPITARILEALVAARPEDRAVFEANRARFLARLDAGLARWRRRLVPFAGARLVVVHDTWPYFARRFDLAITGAVEEKPGVPSSPAHLARLIERMRAAGVRVIVAEPGASPAIVRRLAGATGARVATLAPSVGAEPDATDYITLFDVNVERLARALGGEAGNPARVPRP